MKNSDMEDELYIEQISLMSDSELEEAYEEAKLVAKKEGSIPDFYFNKDKSYERFAQKFEEVAPPKRKKKGFGYYAKVASFFLCSLLATIGTVVGVKATQTGGLIQLDGTDDIQNYLILGSEQEKEKYILVNEIYYYDNLDLVEGLDGTSVLVGKEAQNIILNIVSVNANGDLLSGDLSMQYQINDSNIQFKITFNLEDDLLVTSYTPDGIVSEKEWIVNHDYEATVIEYETGRCEMYFRMNHQQYSANTFGAMEDMEQFLSNLEEYKF